jgi:hypothetical protein
MHNSQEQKNECMMDKSWINNYSLCITKVGVGKFDNKISSYRS